MTGRARHPGTKHDRPRGVQSRHPRAYARQAKGAGALVCEDCGVVQHRGKWSWGKPPLVELRACRCPACQRVRDRCPAGFIRLPADFCAQRDEVRRLIRNVEQAEKAEHPLERVMGIEAAGAELVVTTTGVHLARQLAHKLARRFHRKPHVSYTEAEGCVHVDWGD